MKQNIKDWIQYGSAIAMLITSMVLAIWSFSEINEVHSTVLTYSGIAVSFCSAVYGLALYAKNEIHRELRKMRERDIEEMEEEKDEDA